MKKLLLAILAALSFSAQAYDSKVGTIVTLDAAPGTNYAFRAYFLGNPAMCSAGSSTFAYTNVADDNYAQFASLLKLAYVMNQTVTLTLDPVGGQCHILEVRVN